MRSDLNEVRNWLLQGAKEKAAQEAERRDRINRMTNEADALQRDSNAMSQAASVIEQFMGPQVAEGSYIAAGRIDRLEKVPVNPMNHTAPWSPNMGIGGMLQGAEGKATSDFDEAARRG